MNVTLDKHSNIWFICFDDYFSLNKMKFNTIFVKDGEVHFIDRKIIKIKDIK